MTIEQPSRKAWDLDNIEPVIGGNQYRGR
jgi:hypothetical protein